MTINDLSLLGSKPFEVSLNWSVFGSYNFFLKPIPPQTHSADVPYALEAMDLFLRLPQHRARTLRSHLFEYEDRHYFKH